MASAFLCRFCTSRSARISARRFAAALLARSGAVSAEESACEDRFGQHSFGDGFDEGLGVLDVEEEFCRIADHVLQYQGGVEDVGVSGQELHALREQVMKHEARLKALEPESE
jgi:hypothetical protein